jgi:hypothetical protein
MITYYNDQVPSCEFLEARACASELVMNEVLMGRSKKERTQAVEYQSAH